MQTAFDKMAAMIPRMQQLIKLFTDPDTDQPNAFTEVLHFLCDEVAAKSDNFREWQGHIGACSETVSSTSAENSSEFAVKVEGMISAILLGVQKLNKYHVAMETENQVPSKEDGEGSK